MGFAVANRSGAEVRAVHDRIRFINHEGKKILLVDLSDCPANEVEQIARAVPDYREGLEDSRGNFQTKPESDGRLTVANRGTFPRKKSCCGGDLGRT